jgi:hypothetical protein
MGDPDEQASMIGDAQAQLEATEAEYAEQEADLDEETELAEEAIDEDN